MAFLHHRNDQDVPDRPIILFGLLSALLTWAGSLSALVEAASLAFLAAFSTVHLIAWDKKVGQRWNSGMALVLIAVVGVLLLYRLATTKHIALGLILTVFAVSYFLRPRLLRHARTEGGG